MKRYQEWAFNNFPLLSERDDEDAKGFVQEAYHAAGGQVLVLGFLSCAALFLIVKSLISSMFESGIVAELIISIIA